MIIFLKITKNRQDKLRVVDAVEVRGVFSYEKLYTWLDEFKKSLESDKYDFAKECPKMPKTRKVIAEVEDDGEGYYDESIQLVKVYDSKLLKIKRDLYRFCGVNAREMNRNVQSRDNKYCRIRQLGMVISYYLVPKVSGGIIAGNYGKDHSTLVKCREESIPGRMLKKDKVVLNTIDYFSKKYKDEDLYDKMLNAVRN